jgi:prevent-host-death family protein
MISAKKEPAMTTVSAYEAKTHLPRLLRAAERGETVIITRHGKPVAQLGPVQDRRREEIAEVIERMKRARAQRPRVTVKEILSARDEGRKP